MGDKSKYGWIVFEDMEGAESCIAHIHANKLNASSLYCSLVPEHINTLEMVVMQTFTVQFEGISRKQRKREKIKNILDNVCPQICNQVQEIRVRQFDFLNFANCENFSSKNFWLEKKSKN